jgi:hypothetical protein
MASEHAKAPPALRWVALFLALCAALGVWMGFRDQIRRNPPDWYTGASTGSSDVVTTGGAVVRDATPYDPAARGSSSPQAEKTTPAEKAVQEDLAEAEATAQAAVPAPAVAEPAPLAIPPAPAASRPRAPSQPAPSDDPVGDILDGQRPAPAPSEPPPTVPY